MATEGAYARLHDLCESRGLHLELAGGVDSPLVIEIRAGATRHVKRAFRVPTGRSLEQAAAALLYDEFQERSPAS